MAGRPASACLPPGEVRTGSWVSDGHDGNAVGLHQLSKTQPAVVGAADLRRSPLAFISTHNCCGHAAATPAGRQRSSRTEWELALGWVVLDGLDEGGMLVAEVGAFGQAAHVEVVPAGGVEEPRRGLRRGGGVSLGLHAPGVQHAVPLDGHGVFEWLLRTRRMTTLRFHWNSSTLRCRRSTG
jgi:hypothetical protein